MLGMLDVEGAPDGAGDTDGACDRLGAGLGISLVAGVGAGVSTTGAGVVSTGASVGLEDPGAGVGAGVVTA